MNPPSASIIAAIVGSSLVWGRLAAVRRTLEWASLRPLGPSQAPYLGQNCARLVDQALVTLRGDEGGTPQHDQTVATLDALMVQLGALDQTAPDQWADALAAAVAVSESILPLAQAGASVAIFEPRARLLLPRSGRRRGRRRGQHSSGTEGSDRPVDGAGETPRPESAGSESAPAVTADAPLDTLAVAPGADAPGADIDAAQLVADQAEPESESEPESEPESESESDFDALMQAALASASQNTRGTPRAGSGRISRGRRAPDAPVRLPFHHQQRGGAPLSAVPGIDPQLLPPLRQVGIQTVAQLLLLPPSSFDRRPQLRDITDSVLDEPQDEFMLRGVVLRRCTRLSPGVRRHELVLGLRDDLQLVARWIGEPPRGFSSWRTGTEVALVGTVDMDDADLSLAVRSAAPAVRTLSVYQAETVGLNGRGSGWLGRYGIAGVDDRDLRDAIARALDGLMGRLADSLPGRVLENQRLLGLDEALRDAHFPANTTRRGRTRMAFEELFLLQLGVALRSRRDGNRGGVSHTVHHGFLGQLELQHGIVLDDPQQRALDDILRDLVQPGPMARLLQGDVGTGKGLVALLSAVCVVEGRGQVAMVCPDALTAERRLLFAEPLLRSLGIAAILAGGPLSHVQADAIKRGEAHMVYGTRALLDDKVSWKRLGLIVVEERDQFGTVSPQDLSGRSVRPDLLVMTTVPIPASLALSVFGEFDLTVVPRRGAVSTVPRVFSGEQRGQVYDLVREQIALGHQAMVVFPVSQGKDLLGPQDAQRYADAMRREFLPDTRMAVYASAMGREDRFRVFDDFAHRRINVLISTTYIEDAPAVDNATVMVVEHADKHSLVRLHRLRSHLRRGFCAFVMGNQPSQDGRRLVELVQQEPDGFRLSELDLQVRGVQALLGERSTEAPEFAWADPPEDRALLLRARAEAFDVARLDPNLRRSSALARAVQYRWGHWLGAPIPSPKPAPERNTSGRRRRRRRRRPGSS